MPHTSRKKKREYHKRIQVVDDDGWTRVMTSRDLKTSTLQRLPHYNLYFDPNTTTTRPEVIQEEGASVEKKVSRYNVLEKSWLDSESCKALLAAVRDIALVSKIQIDKCIILGSGTLCGLVAGWIEKHDRALIQVAVLKTMQKTLEKHLEQPIPAYAQEPQYLPLDKEILKALNIEVVDDPAAFDMITNTTLVYTPGAEHYVDVWVMDRNPGVYLAHKGSKYVLDRTGKHTTACNQGCFLDNDINGTCKTVLELEDSDDPAQQTMARGLRRLMQKSWDDENDVIQDFTKSKRSVDLPDADGLKDSPFYLQRLYWTDTTGGEDSQVSDGPSRDNVGVERATT